MTWLKDVRINVEQENMNVRFRMAEEETAKRILLQMACRFLVIRLDRILRGTTKLVESVLSRRYHAWRNIYRSVSQVSMRSEWRYCCRYMQGSRSPEIA
jgi:hypothetical protein